MSDMTQAIVPKSDQLNADDLIGREMTIKITGVAIRGGQEQPVSISFEGDNGKPYKACKSMCRVMVSAWGADSSRYVGRSMTLYRDASVKWGGMEVGGIRISHMSHIEKPMTMALTMTRANKKPFTVKPLASGTQTAAAQVSTAKLSGEPSQEDLRQGELATAAAPGATPESLARQKAQEAFNMASIKVKAAFATMNEGGAPIAQMTEKGANNAYKWLTAAIDKESVA